jgi:hypothetical protein
MSAGNAGSGSEPSASVTRPSEHGRATVQYSMVNGGWTVICPTCRVWFGPFVAQGYAQQVADDDHLHAPANGPYTGGHNDIQAADSGSSEATP